MNKYQKLEQDVLNALSNGDNPVLELLREQYKNAEVTSVDETGCGVLFTYEISNKENLEAFKKDFHIGDLLVEVPSCSLPIGSVLFIRDGYIDTLELHAYDDLWPESLDGYVVKYDAETRDIPKLIGVRC